MTDLVRRYTLIHSIAVNSISSPIEACADHVLTDRRRHTRRVQILPQHSEVPSRLLGERE